MKIESSRRCAKDGELDRYVYVCNKSGKPREEEAVPVKERNRKLTVLTDCKVKLRVKRDGARWKVTQFVEEHTHEVIDKFALKKYLRSHNKIPTEEKKFVDLLHEVNLTSGRIMEIMGELYGSKKNVPYNNKTVSNYTAKLGNYDRIKDIPEVLKYFEEIKKDDPIFFYRSEGFNDVLKQYVHPLDSLVRFFKQYMKLQERIDVVEDGHEFNGDDKIVRLWGDYPMEKQILLTYTMPINNHFQLGLRKITSYNVRDIGVTEQGSIHEVVPIQGSERGYGRRSYRVDADVTNGIYNCECCKINMDGILCCHAMKVMSHLGMVKKYPEHYILPRWCLPPPDIVAPQNERQEKPVGQKLSRKDMRLLRYGNMCTNFTKLAVGLAASEKTNEIAERHMRAMDKEMADLKKAAADALKKKKSA
ncbi:hypothetical protein ACQ4PT_066323 [Festuca glaucescens]